MMLSWFVIFRFFRLMDLIIKFFLQFFGVAFCQMLVVNVRLFIGLMQPCLLSLMFRVPMFFMLSN